MAPLPELNRPVVIPGETTAILIDATKNLKEGEDTYPRKIDFLKLFFLSIPGLSLSELTM